MLVKHAFEHGVSFTFASIAIVLLASHVGSMRVRTHDSSISTSNECTELGIDAVHRNWAHTKARKCRCRKEEGMVLSADCGPLQGQYKFDSKNPHLKLPGCKCVSNGNPRQMTPRQSSQKYFDPVVGHLLVKGHLALVRKSEDEEDTVGPYYFSLTWEKVPVNEGGYVKEVKPASANETTYDIDWCAVDWSCDSVATAWQKQRFIKSGSYGAVWRVKLGPYGEDSAMKVPVTDCGDLDSPDAECEQDRQEGCEDIRQEALKIYQITRKVKTIEGCESCIMQVKDAAPCVLDADLQPAPEAGSYVMPLMTGDMQSWYDKASKGLRDRCMPNIMQTIAVKLRCLHRAGWVHGDMKPGNVLYDGVWTEGVHAGCPRDIRIADFGMSGKIDTKRKQFSESSYRSYTYLPSDMFNIHPWAVRWGQDHVLGLADGAGYFTYQPQLDWCAFQFSFSVWLDAEYDNPYWSGDCGLMGYKDAENFIVYNASYVVN